jgi:NAD+ synthase
VKLSSPGQEFPIRLSLHPQLTEAVLVDFIRREVLRTGRERAVVGVSGGVDSAVVLALATKALGPRSVLGVVLPYRGSHGRVDRNSDRVLKTFGARRFHRDISESVDAYFQDWPNADEERRTERISRERMSILYDLSSRERAWVLGTCNKTELLLGYGTLHGDSTGALIPLGDLYRTQVRRLARHFRIPHAILRRGSSSGLGARIQQRALVGLGEERLDRLLHLLVDLRASRMEALRLGFPRGRIERVIELIRVSQFKRSPPVIAKISHRTLGVDFRYPRDWGV